MRDATVAVTVSIPGPPGRKQRPRFNRTTGHTYTPRDTREHEEVARWHLRTRCPRPLAGDVAVTLTFELPKSRGRADIDNLVKLILDAANGIVWIDDRQVVELHVYLRRDCVSPSTTIRVEETHD